MIRTQGSRIALVRQTGAKVLLVLAGIGVWHGGGGVAFGPRPAGAQQLDDLPLDRWKKLRENERYQLQIAEKYYREQNWKVAAAEYEKYLSLYEKSEASAYAQLKWSLAQVQLKKLNTAVKEGFQSVIDYWPDAPEAMAARFYLGRTYKAMGQIPKAKTAYKELTTKFPDQVASAYAMSDLAELALNEKDNVTRLAMLKKLTFEVKRTPPVNSPCVQASIQLAVQSFETGAVDDGVKSLATTYAEKDLPAQVVAQARGVVARLAQDKQTLSKAEKSADGVIGYLRATMPSDLTNDMAKLAARANWYAIAEFYGLSLRDDRALEAYDQLHKALGATDESLGRLAQFQKSRAKYEDARATYRRFENKIEGLGQIAYSYREQSNADSAIEVYKQLVGRDAMGAAKWKAEMAATYRAAKKYMEAIGVYEDLIATDSANHGKWRWELASTHRDAGRYKEAIGHFRQCDNFPENFKQMAACHRQLKEHNEAVLLYNQIVTADMNNAPWALLQIGYTREEAGQKEPAIQTFQQVCKRYPKDGHASIAHAHLQNKYKISITLGGAKDE